MCFFNDVAQGVADISPVSDISHPLVGKSVKDVVNTATNSPKEAQTDTKVDRLNDVSAINTIYNINS